MKTTDAPPRDVRGYAMLSILTIFAVIIVFATLLVNATLMSRKAGKFLEADFTAVQIAEAGIDKALYCLNASIGTHCGGSHGLSFTGDTGVMDSGAQYTTVVNVSGTEGTIVSTGLSADGKEALIKVDVTTVPPNDDLDFSYALQTGEGGAHLDNNASVEGTVYSNGDLTCQSILAIFDGDAFVGKVSGEINGCTVNYHAYADRIIDGVVHGNAYYRNDPDDIAGTTVDGSSNPSSATPAPEPLPDFDLDFWRTSAVAGGTILGDYMPTDGEIIGPKKIEGDLILNNNVDITLLGPLWITGNLITNNNASISLDPSFGPDSTTILADDPDGIDGKLLLTSGVELNGSGETTSNILLVSTNPSSDDLNPAIDIWNTASGAIFYSLNGTIRLHNNAGAKSINGYRLYLDNNASVTYIESELAGLNFSNSPGGIWRIEEGTWTRKK